MPPPASLMLSLDGPKFDNLSSFASAGVMMAAAEHLPPDMNVGPSCYMKGRGEARKLLSLDIACPGCYSLLRQLLQRGQKRLPLQCGVEFPRPWVI